MTRYAPRHRAKRDTSELPIVGALEAVGVKVYRKLPVDLLCRLARDPPGVLRTLEVKTAKGKTPKLRLRKDQEDQAQFIADTGTPYVTNMDEALRALGLIT